MFLRLIPFLSLFTAVLGGSAAVAQEGPEAAVPAFLARAVYMAQVDPNAYVNDPDAPTAIFFALENKGAEDDRFLSVATPVCRSAEIHDHIHDNGVMKMRVVPKGVAVPAGGQVIFRPGGLHVMCFNPLPNAATEPKFDLTLRFVKAGEMTVSGMIRPIETILRDPALAAPKQD